MSAPVIPDSIEPYKGYKALNVAPDGMLCSPSEHTLWPVRERLEANCTRGYSQWSWVPIEGKPRKMEETRMVTARHTGAMAISAVTAIAMSNTTMNVPRNVPPTNPLPPGWSWSWEPLTHDAPAEGCSCGIYAVDKPANCLSYVKPTGVICEIAVWGTVVPASQGVRGQYAYPQSILAPQEIVDELKVTADMYGIPIVVLNPPTPREWGITLAPKAAPAPAEPVDVTTMGDTVKKTVPGPPAKKPDPVVEAIRKFWT